jgi:NAD(P)-dependent dehydrogenase (short-subunit alcohol dehydrogenase family)
VQFGAPLLARNGGGSVTVIGSISGVVAIAGQSLYGSAKAALHHLVRCAAAEFGPGGVRVNAVAPGHTRTPRLVEKYDDAAWERFAAANPLRRPAEPEDIAATVLFLASDLGGYVTGNVLTLDGGLTNTVPS